jgi:c-di-GMP-binding flagellar brake protein YcgR
MHAMSGKLPALPELFKVGSAIAIEVVQKAGEIQTFPSRVEDILPDQLVVGMPMRMGMFVVLPAGMPVKVSVTREDATYLLPARVRGYRADPVRLLELLATGPVERRQQRHYVRLDVSMTPRRATVLSDNRTETPFACTIVNISAGGIRLRTLTLLEVDQRLRLNIDLSTAAGLFAMTARVLRVVAHQTERGTYYEAGCRFLDLSVRDRDAITKFILQTQAEHIRRSASRAR